MAESRESPTEPWPEDHAAAWIGLLEAHKHLTRELESELAERHGLGLSTLELLVRLSRADRHTLRLTTLADQAGLSLSRVSRIIGALENRGLVARDAASDDARAKNARLTAAGSELVALAQQTHAETVRRLFLSRLSDRDIRTLARVFAPWRR